MKPARVIGILFGLGMVGLAVGAYFSGEPASRTDQGRIVTVVFGLMGLLMFVNNLTGKTKTDAPMAPPAAAPPPATAAPTPFGNTGTACPSCHRPVSADHRFCPTCGTPLQARCPACGREVQSEYNVCPYCATRLK